MSDVELARLIRTMEGPAANRGRSRETVIRVLRERGEAFIAGDWRYWLDGTRLCREPIIELVEPRTVRRAVAR